MAQSQPLNFLITGAGRGIGRGLSRLLLQKGHRVFLVDNNAEELQHTTSRVLSRFPPGSFSSSLTDLRSPQQIRDAVSRASAFFSSSPGSSGDHPCHHPRLDVLINNAAFTGAVGIPFEALTLEDWNQALEVNLTAPMLLSQACLPLLRGREGEGEGEGEGEERRRGGGTIINVSSTRARQSEPGGEGYGTTKAGLLGLTQSLASSLAGAGVTVNAILPGWIHVANECKEADEKGMRWEDGLSGEDHRWHLSGRVGRVEDVLGAVEFLVRERFVNGQEIVVDGGVSRKMVYPE